MCVMHRIVFFIFILLSVNMADQQVKANEETEVKKMFEYTPIGLDL